MSKTYDFLQSCGAFVDLDTEAAQYEMVSGKMERLPGIV